MIETGAVDMRGLYRSSRDGLDDDDDRRVSSRQSWLSLAGTSTWHPELARLERSVQTTLFRIPCKASTALHKRGTLFATSITASLGATLASSKVIIPCSIRR